MYFAARTVAPRDASIDPSDEIVVHAERGFFAVVTGGASTVSAALPASAARRAIGAFLSEVSGPPDRARLHALIARVASAVREAGELVGRPGWPEALEAVTGAGFVPDPSHHGNGFGLEAAFAWLAGNRAFVAAIGRAAAVRASGGEITPLHRLHVLAEDWPPGVPLDPDLGFRVVTSVLALDPTRPLGALHELEVDLAPGDRLALVSPAAALPLFAGSLRPPAEIAEGPPAALADWLAARISAREGEQGAAIVISPERGFGGETPIVTAI